MSMSMNKTTQTDHFPTDLFPNGVSFQYPDHMVRLADYYLALMMELTHENIARKGDRIPASTITARLCDEFALDAETVHHYKGIGMWVHYDRELRDLSPEQLAVRELMDTPTADEQAEFDAEFGDDLLDVLRQAHAESEERQRWNDEMNGLMGEG